MNNYDWSKFTKRISVNADLQTLYGAWTTQQNIERWFLSKAKFAQPDGSVRNREDFVQEGDTYAWCWYGYPEETTTERGKVLKANGTDLFQFTFAGDCIVSVSLKSENGENVVELTQENIPLDEQSKVNYHLGCSEGWTFYLANLKSMLEGGIDLRNKNEELTKVINS